MSEPSSLMPLEVSALSFSVKGDRLIDGISFRLESEGVTAIMGPNGAGKSLLVRLLHGLVAGTSGKISWNGVAMGEAVRARQAMVFQKPVLLRRTVAANVDFVLGLRGQSSTSERDKILQEAGLLGKANQPARTLSGGEQQRLALARALACHPAVLFLDEPTASLDPSATLQIEKTVELASTRGTKVILVTHDPGQAQRLASDVIFLHHGKVIEQASAETFFEKPETPEARGYLAGNLLV